MGDGYKTVTFPNGYEVIYKDGCDHCGRKHLTRHWTGPTGRKDWGLRVDSCYDCGSIYPALSEHLTDEQKDWVERFNRRSRVNHDERSTSAQQ